MTNPAQHSTLVLRSSLRRAACALALLCTMPMIATRSAQAQTFSVIHSFTGGYDGNFPYAGLTADRYGNFCGTASYGGSNGAGIVFKLARAASGWTLTPLHGFAQFQNDGFTPLSGVTIGGDGSLYGTTEQGGGYCDGNDAGCGTVFQLRPSSTGRCRNVICPWTETQLHVFTGPPDADLPSYGDLVLDEGGNIYGAAPYGGFGIGAIYEVSPSGGGWTESVIYAFPAAGVDGAMPLGSLVFDTVGNLYGTTQQGGANSRGSVYQLTPSGSGWTESVLHSFQGPDGASPYAGLTSDQSGNLYGTTSSGGPNGGGTVFELTPSNGGWIFTTLYGFVGPQGPRGGVTIDAAGNLYGTQYENGAHDNGSVFRLTHSEGGWTYNDLYDFTGGNDGALPYGAVTIDSNGNIFGTTSQGGPYNCQGVGFHGCGVVWEVSP